jgi:hypothetical protein
MTMYLRLTRARFDPALADQVVPLAGEVRTAMRRLHRRERVRPVKLDGAVGSGDQERDLGQPPGEVPEQQEGRPVRPVEVVEDQEHAGAAGPGPGDVEQELRDALEQAVPFVLRAQRRTRRQVRQPGVHLPYDQGDVGGAISKLSPQLHERASADVVAQCLRPR